MRGDLVCGLGPGLLAGVVERHRSNADRKAILTRVMVRAGRGSVLRVRGSQVVQGVIW